MPKKVRPRERDLWWEHSPWNKWSGHFLATCNAIAKQLSYTCFGAESFSPSCRRQGWKTRSSKLELPRQKFDAFSRTNLAANERDLVVQPMTHFRHPLSWNQKPSVAHVGLGDTSRYDKMKHWKTYSRDSIWQSKLVPQWNLFFSNPEYSRLSGLPLQVSLVLSWREAAGPNSLVALKFRHSLSSSSPLFTPSNTL